MPASASWGHEDCQGGTPRDIPDEGGHQRHSERHAERHSERHAEEEQSKEQSKEQPKEQVEEQVEERPPSPNDPRQALKLGLERRISARKTPSIRAG